MIRAETSTDIAIIEKPSDRLAGLAREINVRLQKADDHRLSAALKLAEAKVACAEAGVSFKSWVAAEIRGIGYPEATILAKIGGASEPAKALSDFRAKKSEGARERRAEKVGYVANSRPEPVAALPRPPRGKDVVIARVRDAVTALTLLPSPQETLKYLDGTDDALLIGERLPAAAQWLAAFNELWAAGEEKHVEAAE